MDLKFESNIENFLLNNINDPIINTILLYTKEDEIKKKLEEYVNGLYFYLITFKFYSYIPF